MTTKIIKSIMVLGLLAATLVVSPSVGAQNYGAPTVESTAGLSPIEEQNAEILAVIRAVRDCGALAPATGSNSGRTVVITFSATLGRCAENIVVQINPVLFDGPVPATNAISFDIPDEFESPWVVDLTASLKTGGTYNQTFTFTAEGLAAASRTRSGTAASPPLSLAFTGNSVSTPLLASAGLILAGSVVLFVGRRRELADA